MRNFLRAHPMMIAYLLIGLAFATGLGRSQEAIARAQSVSAEARFHLCKTDDRNWQVVRAVIVEQTRPNHISPKASQDPSLIAQIAQTNRRKALQRTTLETRQGKQPKC